MEGLAAGCKFFMFLRGPPRIESCETQVMQIIEDGREEWIGDEKKLPRQDSNLDKESQNLIEDYFRTLLTFNDLRHFSLPLLTLRRFRFRRR
jgi:hypothetical protein